MDVIGYSISGSNTTTSGCVSLAFLNAAAAEFSCRRPGGNSGPGSQHSQPCRFRLTGVAASTFDSSSLEPLNSPTVQVLRGQRYAREVASKPIVLAVAVKGAAAADADAALCISNTLDPARAAGQSRGVRAHASQFDKGVEVKRARGVGMVLVNLVPGSLDADMHSVPTVHVGDPKVKDVVAANPGLTANLKATDTEGAASRRPRSNSRPAVRRWHPTAIS